MDDAELLLKYNLDNKAHLMPWEPIRNKAYFTLAGTEAWLQQSEVSFHSNTALPLAAFDHGETEIIALCHFSNIVYGPFQACHLGYSIAKKYEGRGLMTEVLNITIEYVFEELKLHRIMANYIPANVRSEALLARLGFEKEGYAKSYLKIAGLWQDHVLTAKINRCE